MERGRTSAGLGGSRVPVYFDFGDSEPKDAVRFDAPTLWRLNPCDPNGKAYLAAVPKAVFLRAHLNGEPFEETCREVVERVAAHHLLKQAPRSRPLMGFERYLARRQLKQRRF